MVSSETDGMVSSFTYLGWRGNFCAVLPRKSEKIPLEVSWQVLDIGL